MPVVNLLRFYSHDRKLWVFSWLYLGAATVYLFGSSMWLQVHQFLMTGCTDDGMMSDGVHDTPISYACRMQKRLNEEWRLHLALTVRMVALALVIYTCVILGVVLMRRRLTQDSYDHNVIIFVCAGLLHLIQEVVWRSYWMEPWTNEDIVTTFMTCATSGLMLFITVGYTCSGVVV